MQNETEDFLYQVIEVVKTTAPEGMAGDNWHRYVIRKGRSVIDCKKTGTLKAITEHAENLAELINSRNVSGGKAYATRKKS